MTGSRWFWIKVACLNLCVEASFKATICVVVLWPLLVSGNVHLIKRGEFKFVQNNVQIGFHF